jgi:signal transduction histidine kinase/CheY-like chemotaxis protein
MSFHDSLTIERRARLAAERIFERREAELAEANRRISAHARLLTERFAEKREEAEHLRLESSLVRHDLEVAQNAIQSAERRLWDAVDSIRDGFAVFDSKDILIAANSAYLAPFDGLAYVTPGISYVEILLLAAEEGIIDVGNERREDWCSRMLARWKEPTIEPLTIRFWNGQFARLIDRRTQDGDTVTLALNITSTMRRERALKKAREKAEAANRAKSAFLANMSHEIRTPMNGVVGMADILLETPLTDDQKLYIQTIRNSGEALLAIINDVLDYSKIEAHRLALHPAPFDLEDVIQEVLTLLTPSAQEKGLTLALDYDLFLPTRLVGDAGRIRQVLTNLVGNAVKFTEKGGVSVRVIGRPGGPGFRHVTVSVEDTGIGIPPNMRRHIFGEFNQIEDEMNRRFDGTGLGLAISRSLIELMSGEIWLDSEVGKGSCFSFRVRLPVEEREGGSRRVADWIDRAFLLESDERNRQLTTSQLVALGLPVVSVKDPATLRTMSLGPNDILVVSDSVGEKSRCERFHQLLADVRPALTLILTRSLSCAIPQGVGEVRVLPQPVLRQHLLDSLSDLPSPDQHAGQGAPAAAAPAGLGLRRLRLLAAEDNKTNQLVFAKMLSGFDIELLFADDGVEAVEKFESFRPDIVFTDISMPRMDGKEAAGRIRDIERRLGLPPTPIVAMTAHALEGDADAILAAGIDHYLTKPIRKADLTARLLEVAREELASPFPPASDAGSPRLASA